MVSSSLVDLMVDQKDGRLTERDEHPLIVRSTRQDRRNTVRRHPLAPRIFLRWAKGKKSASTENPEQRWCQV